MADRDGEDRYPTEGLSPREGILETAKGGGFLVGGNAFALISRFGIAFILARSLGASDYGLYNLAISAVVIFAGVASLGMDSAMVRYVSILVARKTERGIWGTLQLGAGVAVLGGLVMGVFLYLAAAPIAATLFDEPELEELLKILSLFVPFLTISNVLAGVSRGFGRMDHAALAENVVGNVLRLVVLGILSLIELDVMVAVIVYGVADVVATVAFILLINRHFPLHHPFRRDVERPVREVFGFAIPLWISGLINQFRRNIETIFLGALSVAANVGIYAIVARVNLMSHLVYRSLVVSVKPVLARYHDQGDHDGLATIYATTTRWALAFNLPVFMVTVLYAEPILQIFGSTFTEGTEALIILAFSELVIAATGTCGSLIDMAGHTKAKLFNSVFWVVMLATTNALLIPRWGVVGAATASLIATASVNLLRLVQVRILDGMWPYRAIFWKPIVAGVVAFSIGWGLSLIVPVDGSLGIAVAQGSAVVLVYGVILRLFGFEPEDRLVLSRVARRVGRLTGSDWLRSKGEHR